MRTKKYALQGTYAGEKRGEGPLYFALFNKCEIEKEPPDLKDQAAGVQEQTLLRPDAVDAGAWVFGWMGLV